MCLLLHLREASLLQQRPGVEGDGGVEQPRPLQPRQVAVQRGGARGGGQARAEAAGVQHEEGALAELQQPRQVPQLLRHGLAAVPRARGGRPLPAPGGLAVALQQAAVRAPGGGVAAQNVGDDGAEEDGGLRRLGSRSCAGTLYPPPAAWCPPWCSCDTAAARLGPGILSDIAATIMRVVEWCCTVHNVCTQPLEDTRCNAMRE